LKTDRAVQKLQLLKAGIVLKALAIGTAVRISLRGGFLNYAMQGLVLHALRTLRKIQGCTGFIVFQSGLSQILPDLE